MKETLRAECARLGLSLSEKQLDQFAAFGQALIQKNKVMNLTAITEPAAVAKLHFADCLALLRAADFQNKSVIDVGCGAGFPGVPLKIGEPSVSLTLLDSLQKRIRWLEETLEEMKIRADCIAARAEEYRGQEKFDIAVSRAVARLNILCELCMPFVKPGGLFIAMKASAAQEELQEAARAVCVLGGKVENIFEYEIDGAPRCAILIRKIRSTPPAYPRRFAKIKQSPL